MYEVIIEKLDNHGRGICYINDKITFVKNALPNEVVSINITKESKKYNEAEVVKYLNVSKDRIESICPYYLECGGCNLLHMKYEDTISFKKEKLEGIMAKYANIKKDIPIIKSKENFSYRNKITLKIINGSYGFYKNQSHELVEIKNCLLAEKAIKKFITDISYLNVKNGEVVIRSNYNDELLINIITQEKINPDVNYLKDNHKIVGILLNGKPIIGDSSFIEIINNQLFTVSYDSFFQINRHICSELFNITKNYITDNSIVLDLYCGVGTLGLNIAKRAKKVYGIEIVENAILNAISNAKINKRDNVYYLLGDVGNCLPKIIDNVDIVIVDPPRAGLDNKTKKTLIDFHPQKIIYISCDPMTLARDLKELQEHYKVTNLLGLDMFPYTYHIETFCVLERN